ncbi:MAG: hypothetical protein JWO22_3282 [Frankiales bacterium]|nr:hypothetical protein [Frankiales bacterium]
MGALTLAYSVAVVVKPKVLAGPCGLTDELGEVPRDVAASVRAISTRDAIISAAMMVAPAGPALRALTTVRGLCDISDGVTLGLPATPEVRKKVIAVGGAWGAVVLLSRRWAG